MKMHLWQEQDLEYQEAEAWWVQEESLVEQCAREDEEQWKEQQKQCKLDEEQNMVSEEPPLSTPQLEVSYLIYASDW